MSLPDNGARIVDVHCQFIDRGTECGSSGASSHRVALVDLTDPVIAAFLAARYPPEDMRGDIFRTPPPRPANPPAVPVSQRALYLCDQHAGQLGPFVKRSA